MESDGVLHLYKRSVINYGIRYNPFIGDGDSSAYATIDTLRPYGALYSWQTRMCQPCNKKDVHWLENVSERKETLKTSGRERS